MAGGNLPGPVTRRSGTMQPKLRSLAAAAAFLALLGGACAKASAPGGASSGGIEHPMSPNDLILKVETGGGFVGPQVQFREFPSFALYGDGRLITEGPQIEIYPGPALPNLQVSTITEDGIQAILEAARAAGLLGPDRHYTTMTIADAPTTTFTVVAEGSRHVTSVYALGEAGTTPPPGMSQDEFDVRRALASVQGKLTDLQSWLPTGSVSDQGAYASDELRIFVLDQASSPEPGLEQQPVDWPLSPGLAGFGQPVTSGLAARCGSVSGDDLKTLLPLAQKSNELTPWRSGGAEYALVFRPLLPDENGCEGV
jgi:hypothetical protein